MIIQNCQYPRQIKIIFVNIKKRKKKKEKNKNKKLKLFNMCYLVSLSFKINNKNNFDFISKV